MNHEVDTAKSCSCSSVPNTGVGIPHRRHQEDLQGGSARL